ncbi:expressed unknown protein [Ectocarpus siliculosus]|uniref:Uncharacterized protein n=1 Tax=Ectocarpus siliculosus TaxID=2880 RepID=D7G1P3_ECTSI|nr:expressed unknown protein [Ectocarpus siliculosus]|eukprot:CBJ33288.1 expressed unknown protein [Ectocarpus siliculosus]
MAPQIAALKLKHAEHILEVVREAEKQEAARQRKLRHATSKDNLAYLQKRFTAERRQDQAHISGLVQDANAVEAALLKEQQPLQGRNSQGRDDPCAAASRGDNASSQGGGDAGGAVNTGGVEGSVGVRRIFSTKSNAYVETAEPKDDSKFISLDQMRFMKYVYSHIDGQKAAKAHTRLMTDVVREEKQMAARPNAHEQRRRRSSSISSSGGDKRMFASNGAGSRRAGPVAGSSVPPVISKAGEGGCNSGSRERQLLERKRGILLEMKGVVSRQAEALDRLVQSSANANVAAENGRRRGGDHNSRQSRPSHASVSTSSSLFTPKGEKSGRNTRSGSCPDISGLTNNSPAMLPSSATRPTAALPMPPTVPPDNVTSAFLARGGRWGGESRRGSWRCDSVTTASSASYATYCKRDRDQGRVLGISRRPPAVPALPV